MDLVRQVAVTLTGGGALAVIGVIIALWIASMGAAWKVATILSAISAELRELRAETAAATAAAVSNSANIATLQQRWNVPQAEEAAAR